MTNSFGDNLYSFRDFSYELASIFFFGYPKNRVIWLAGMSTLELSWSNKSYGP